MSETSALGQPEIQAQLISDALLEASVGLLDGTGTLRVFYATFETRTAGMPFMATLLAPLPE